MRNMLCLVAAVGMVFGAVSAQEPAAVVAPARTVEANAQPSGDANLKTTNKALARLGGIVRDANGAPLAGAVARTIGLMAKTQDGGPEAVTDEKGEFELFYDASLLELLGMRAILVQVRHAALNLAEIASAEPDTKVLVVKLRRGVIVKGLVEDEEGKPVAKAHLWAADKRIPWSGQGLAMTNDKGRYEVRALLPGETVVMAWGDGFGRAKAEMEIDGEKGEVEVAKLVLKAAKLSIAGVVKDSGGRPAADIVVAVGGEGQPQVPTVRTDKDGKFTVAGLVKGKVTVRAYSDRGATEVEAVAGNQDVQIMLDSSGGEAPPPSDF